MQVAAIPPTRSTGRSQGEELVNSSPQPETDRWMSAGFRHDFTPLRRRGHRDADS